MIEQLFELKRAESREGEFSETLIFTGTERECFDKFQEIANCTVAENATNTYSSYSSTPVSDYLPYYDRLEDEVQKVLTECLNEEMDYNDCKVLEEKLNALNYTIDYGLDAEMFDLMPKKFYAINIDEITAVKYNASIDDSYKSNVIECGEEIETEDKEEIKKVITEGRYPSVFFDQYGNKYESEEIKY